MSARRAEGVAPTVTALRRRAGEVVDAELARLDGRLPPVPDGAREEMTRTVRRVVDKILHTPTVRVKELAGAPGGVTYDEALRELFRLAEGASSPGEDRGGVGGARSGPSPSPPEEDMISDRNPRPTSVGDAVVEPPADEAQGREPHGLVRGIVWSELAAEMRAEAAAAGDDRFERLDALVTPRRSAPFEAAPIDLARVRAERAAAERAARESGERAA
ncbi:hypothetical protein [Actinomycetospora aeridis]|uniref:hypothetical protein n=1 Tax=Actinomycetospora aeridis TaxID=3129231 RepID=UPI0035A0074A